MAIVNLEYPKFRALDAVGNPLSLGKVKIYLAGTTTLATTYTDAVRTAQNTNPVILSTGGEAEIWFDVAVDVEILDASDVLQDKILGVAANLTSTITGNFNLVQNGSFEVDDGADNVPDNWTVSEETNAVIAIDKTVQAHGHNSLKFNGGGSGGGTATSTKFDVLAGDNLSIQYTYKSSNAATTNSLQIKWYDKSDALVSTTTVFNEAAANPTSFTTYNAVAAAPATAIQGEVVLTGVSSGGGQLSEDTWFDAIIITQKDATIARVDETQTLTAKTLTSPVLNTPVINTSVSGTGFLNEPDLASNSAVKIASQQSIKTYVDSKHTYLDTPVVLVSASSTVGSWSSVALSSSYAGAKVAILQSRCVISRSATSFSATLYARKSGSGLAADTVTMKGSVGEIVDTSASLVGVLVTEFHVPLNASRSFDWYLSGVGITGSTYLTLIGYVV